MITQQAENKHVGADDDMTGELAETSMGQGTEFLPSGGKKH